MTDMTVTETPAARRKRYEAMYEAAPVTAWPDAALLEVLVDRYAPTVVPPCRVCGDALTITSIGGGRATEWACGHLEPDPDAVAGGPDLRVKAGRGTGSADDNRHYERSRFVDYRHEDADVIELIRRFKEHQTRIDKEPLG